MATADKASGTFPPAPVRQGSGTFLALLRLPGKLGQTDPWLAYVLIWGLTPPLFFTPARQIVWTYVLPGLPGLAIATAVGPPGLDAVRRCGKAAETAEMASCRAGRHGRGGSGRGHSLLWRPSRPGSAGRAGDRGLDPAGDRGFDSAWPGRSRGGRITRRPSRWSAWPPRSPSRRASSSSGLGSTTRTPRRRLLPKSSQRTRRPGSGPSRPRWANRRSRPPSTSRRSIMAASTTTR